MTTELAPRYKEPTLLDKMGRWLKDNAGHILSGIVIFGLAEGSNVTNIMDDDPFRDAVEGQWGVNAGFGGDALLDFHPDNGDFLEINMPGNSASPFIDEEGGDGTYEGDGFDDRNGVLLDVDQDGKSDRGISVDGENYAPDTVYISSDGVTVDATGEKVQAVADAAGSDINVWTRTDGMKKIVPTSP